MDLQRNTPRKTLPLLLFLICGVAVPLSAQQKLGRNRYFSQQLYSMACTMNLATMCDTLSDGLHYRVASYGGLPLTVVVNEREVCHIGYSVFTPIQRCAFPAEPLNFIERYSLSLSLPMKRLKTVARQMEEDDVLFNKASFSWLPTAINDTTYDFSLRNDMSKTYIATWSKTGKIACQASFPVSYKLLLGVSMDEIEQELKRRVCDTAVPQADTLQLLADSTLLPSLTNDYYMKRGNVYYFAELNSNTYFEKVEQCDQHNSSYRPLFNSRHRRESLANLLTTTDIKNNYLLKVKQRTYNYTDTLFDVPLSKWVSFCLRTGCTPFFALIDHDGNTADCELVMRNETLGYCHVMRLKVDISDMENRQGTAEARLNAYIPTNNIRYLFKEQKK